MRDIKDLHDILFEEPDEPYHFHIGMRMIKTVLAVFICGLIGWLRGQTTFFSMIAAVLCMQKSTEKALTTSFNRVVGTLIGGVYGVLILFLETKLHVQRVMPLYYLIVSLMLLPVLSTAVALKKPSAAAFSCVVFLSETIYHVGDLSPYAYALNRMLDTVVGIVVALAVNLAIPAKKSLEREKSPAETLEDNSPQDIAPDEDNEESPR